MNELVGMSARRLTALLLALAVGLAACSGAAASPAASSGGEPSAPASAATPSAAGGGYGAPAAPGAIDVQGSLVSSGLYSATWTWQPGNAADPGSGGITLNSDKGTYGNVEVLGDGSITFTSGAPELTAGSPFRGTGGQAHLKNVQGVQIPCGFTLDNDLTGSGSAVLHLKGTLTITGSVWNC
jgi:hypothetical protein